MRRPSKDTGFYLTPHPRTVLQLLLKCPYESYKPNSREMKGPVPAGATHSQPWIWLNPQTSELTPCRANSSFSTVSWKGCVFNPVTWEKIHQRQQPKSVPHSHPNLELLGLSSPIISSLLGLASGKWEGTLPLLAFCPTLYNRDIPHHSDFWQRQQRCSDWLSGLPRNKLPPSHHLISRVSSRLLCGSRNLRAWSFQRTQQRLHFHFTVAPKHRLPSGPPTNSDSVNPCLQEDPDARTRIQAILPRSPGRHRPVGRCHRDRHAGL